MLECKAVTDTGAQKPKDPRSTRRQRAASYYQENRAHQGRKPTKDKASGKQGPVKVTYETLLQLQAVLLWDANPRISK